MPHPKRKIKKTTRRLYAKEEGRRERETRRYLTTSNWHKKYLVLMTKLSPPFCIIVMGKGAIWHLMFWLKYRSAPLVFFFFFFFFFLWVKWPYTFKNLTPKSLFLDNNGCEINVVCCASMWHTSKLFVGPTPTVSFLHFFFKKKKQRIGWFGCPTSFSLAVIFSQIS